MTDAPVEYRPAIIAPDERFRSLLPADWQPRMLISYWYTSNSWPRAWEKLSKYSAGHVDLWADSGAFSAMTTGVTIDVDAYADWLLEYRPFLNAACTLDVIGDPVGTMANTERLWNRGCDVLPAYHMRSERWDIFDHIVDNYPYVCLGGMAGTGVDRRRQVGFVVHCMRRARDRGSAAVFHALGLTDDYLLSNAPLYSADCSTWASARRWGYMLAFDDTTGRMDDITLRDPLDLSKWGPLLRDAGIDPVAALHTDPGSNERNRLALVAYARQEAWCRARIGDVPRPDRPGQRGGLRIYLSVGSNVDFSCLSLMDDPFPHAARALTAVKRTGIHRGRKQRIRSARAKA